MVSLKGMRLGEIKTSRGGSEYIIVEINSYKSVEVRFFSTETVASFRASEIRTGYIKDNNERSVYGVGYLGYGDYQTADNKKAYKTWSGMLERCYSQLLHDKHPTYIGCTVCDEWHSFQVFTEWFNKSYIDGFQLDKDIKTDGNKIYGPDSCLFVSPKDNVIKATAKYYVMISPNGKEQSFYNLTKFCRDNNLTPANMVKVLNGERTHHKGWKKI